VLGSSDIPIVTAYGLILGFIAAGTVLSLWLLNRGTGLRT